MQAIVRREATAIGAEVEKDVFGTTVATIRGSAGRLVALVAHADQVGLVVRGADDRGLLTVAKGSDWKPEGAWRQRVRIETSAGEVRGVVTGEGGEAGATWDSLRVDIGAATRDEALARSCGPAIQSCWTALPRSSGTAGSCLRLSTTARVSTPVSRHFAAWPLIRPRGTSPSSSPHRRRAGRFRARPPRLTGFARRSRSSSRCRTPVTLPARLHGATSGSAAVQPWLGSP